MSAPTTSTPAPLFDLTPEYRDIQRRARELAESVSGYAVEADECRRVHEKTAAALRESGLVRHAVPTRFGGVNDMPDPLAIVLIREALMYAGAHLDSLFGMQGVGSYALAVGGREAVQNDWLPKVAAFEAIAAIALTEPGIGSDLRGVTTTIESTPTGLRVNGRKSFITNGGTADFYCVLGREGDGYSMALVPADVEGLTVTPGADIIAPHILGELTFDNVVVPESHRLGNTGEAFALMLQTLAVFRVTVAGSAVGLAQAAFDEAVRHTGTREQFGRPLIGLGAVSQQLALSWTEIESARAMTYRAAALAKSDPLAHLDMTSIAKVVATEAAGRVVDRSMQSMGRFGMVRGSKIERLYRAARPLRIYEGATEVLLDSLGRQIAKRAKDST